VTGNLRGQRTVTPPLQQTTGKVVTVTKWRGHQSPPQRPRQTGIQYTEAVHNAVVEFTIATDWPFTEKEWAAIWLTGGNQGIGASRSQGYGRYKVTKWDMIGEGVRLNADKAAKKAKAAAAAE
jgi:hypothetical protein